MTQTLGSTLTRYDIHGYAVRVDEGHILLLRRSGGETGVSNDMRLRLNVGAAAVGRSTEGPQRLAPQPLQRPTHHCCLDGKFQSCVSSKEMNLPSTDRPKHHRAGSSVFSGLQALNPAAPAPGPGLRKTAHAANNELGEGASKAHTLLRLDGPPTSHFRLRLEMRDLSAIRFFFVWYRQCLPKRASFPGKHCGVEKVSERPGRCMHTPPFFFSMLLVFSADMPERLLCRTVSTHRMTVSLHL